MKKTAIFFITHKFNTKIETAFLKLKKESKGMDIFIATNKLNKIPKKYKSIIFQFDQEIMMGVGKNGEKLYMSNFHYLPILIKNSGLVYENYWFIEYDVEYTGNWGDIFKSVKSDKSDLLATLIYSHKEDINESWGHWEKCKILNKKYTKLRAFMPIYRISWFGVRAIEKAINKGWGGFYEVFIPTVIKIFGGSLRQIGGNGNYVPENRENLFYRSYPCQFNYIGEFRWRPGHLYLKKNRLYHPVKKERNFLDWRFFLFTIVEHIIYWGQKIKNGRFNL